MKLYALVVATLLAVMMVTAAQANESASDKWVNAYFGCLMKAASKPTELGVKVSIQVCESAYDWDEPEGFTLKAE